MTWNPDDPTTCLLWRSGAVGAILRGIAFDRDPARFMRDEQGVSHSVQTIRFACGCVASDAEGWTSCGEGVHAALSHVSAQSPTAQEFRRLRAAFDSVLSEAWRRRGKQPDNYYEFHEARCKEPFLTFEKWRETHDLLGNSVWQSGFLYADLEHVPLEEHLVLSPDTNRTFRFEFVRDGVGAYQIDVIDTAVLTLIFTTEPSLG